MQQNKKIKSRRILLLIMIQASIRQFKGLNHKQIVTNTVQMKCSKIMSVNRKKMPKRNEKRGLKH